MVVLKLSYTNVNLKINMKLNFVLGKLERTIIIDLENSERSFDDIFTFYYLLIFLLIFLKFIKWNFIGLKFSNLLI